MAKKQGKKQVKKKSAPKKSAPKQPKEKFPFARETKSVVADRVITADAPTGTLAITPVLPQDVQPVVRSVEVVRASVALLVASGLKEPEQMKQADGVLIRIKEARALLEEKRAFVVRPLKDHVKRLEALFKPTFTQLEEADDELRQAVLKRRAELMAEQQAASSKLLAQAQEAQEQGDFDTAIELATKSVMQNSVAKTSFTEDGSVTARKVTEFEVEDFGAIPREYLALDDKKVRAAIRAGTREIPGLRIFETEQLAVSAPAVAGGVPFDA